MTKATIQLTEDQVSFFKCEGYYAIDTLTTPEEVAWMREVYDRIFSEHAGREEGNQFDLAGTDEDSKEAKVPQIINPAKYAPELLDSQLLANANAVAKQLLGPEAVAGFAHAIYKAPHSNTPTPWHQDGAYSDPNMIYKHINFWVPLQDVTVENGCMHFVPRTHKMEVLKHRHINDDPTIHGLELHPNELHHVENEVACPIPAGGATLHTRYTLHYAGANTTDVPRRAIIIGADAPAEKRPGHRTFPWQEETQTARARRASAAAAQQGK